MGQLPFLLSRQGASERWGSILGGGGGTEISPASPHIGTSYCKAGIENRAAGTCFHLRACMLGVWGVHPYPPQRRCWGKSCTERKKGWKGRLEVGRGQRPNEQIS